MDENLDLGFEETLLEPEETELSEPVERSFATVGTVYEDGVSLIFDGETEPTEKHYLCNTNVFFQEGDRVRILADSGTYVVEYVVGAPRQTRLVGIPAGGTIAQVLTKAADADYAAAWDDIPHELPSGGSANQVLTKNSATPYDVKWASVPDPPHELPTGGSNGQVLLKNGTTAYAVQWGSIPPAAKIHNPASSSYPDSDSYVIQFRTVNTYGDGAKQLQFRMGTSATWTTLANA